MDEFLVEASLIAPQGFCIAKFGAQHPSDGDVDSLPPIVRRRLLLHGLRDNKAQKIERRAQSLKRFAARSHGPAKQRLHPEFAG